MSAASQLSTISTRPSFPPASQAIGAFARPSQPRDDLAALQSIGTRLRVRRGETIFNEGDAAEYSYRLVSGSVRLCRHRANGRRQIARFLFPGDLFALADLSEHSFTAEAVSDVVLIAYRQRQIAQLSDENPAIRHYFVKQLSRKASEMQHHLMVLGRQTAKERVASFLLALCDRIGSEEDGVIDVLMSRRDMADYLGLTLETVSRSISELKRERLIQAITSRNIKLLDIESLRALADGDEEI
jgi:CRP-like cAMP-binding protein